MQGGSVTLFRRIQMRGEEGYPPDKGDFGLVISLSIDKIKNSLQ